jgi:lysophospholipase L1-like esterase
MKFTNRLLASAILAAIIFVQPGFYANASAAATLNYTALGDSLAYGILDLSRGGYVPRYADYVQADTGSTVSLNNLGSNGWRSDQLLAALRTDASFRNSITNSQVVTWDIGGNDFLRLMDDYRSGTCGGSDNQNCLRDAASGFKANWNAIITEILALRTSSNTIIRTMDIYNPFVNAQKASDSWANDGGLNDFQVIKAYLDDANGHILTTTEAFGIPCARVYRAFNGPNGDEDAGDKGYISPYDPSRVHPSDTGHRVIADLFRELGYLPLVGQPPTLQLSPGSYSLTEGAGSIAIVVERAGDKNIPVTVNYATSDASNFLQNCNVTNGAATSRCDYVSLVGTLHFAAGENSKTLFLPVVDDTYLEGAETLTLTLSNPSGGALLGANQSALITITDNGNDGTGQPNPIDGTNFFVRQHYIDFLGREPDPASIGWNNQINNCVPVQPSCDRLSVSQGIYSSPEFKDRGYFIYKFYSVAFGRKPTYDEFVLDRARVSGFQTEAELEQSKLDFIADFMSRPEFAAYGGLTNDQYVQRLFSLAGVTQVTVGGAVFDLAAMQQSMNTGKSRARVLREIAESPEVSNKFLVESTIVMHYFGYLRRDPDGAYQDWINIFNQTGDSRNVTNGFVNSQEYRMRFGQ